MKPSGPVPHRVRVNELVATQRSKGFRKNPDCRAKQARFLEPVYSLRQGFCKCFPAQMTQAGIGESSQINKERIAVTPETAPL